MNPVLTHSAGPSSLDDRQLLEQLVARRPEALSELYDRFSPMLLGLAQRVLGGAEDAEEVLQEVFLHVWNHSTSYDPDRSSVSTWLVLLTRSRSIDRLRNRKVVDRTIVAAHSEKGPDHTSPSGVGNVLEGERRRRIAEELAKLPEEQQTVLRLAFYRGLTQREIAEETETPLGTVKTRSLLAMRKLRAALAEEIEDLL